MLRKKKTPRAPPPRSALTPQDVADLAALEQCVDRNDRVIRILLKAVGILAEKALPGEILDVDGCAKLLGLSRHTVLKRVRQDRIPHVRIGGDKCLRFVRTVVEAWVAQGCPRPGTPRFWSRRHAPNKKGG